MVALVPDNTESARRFVAQFNESLAAAKLDALAILRDFVAGAVSPPTPAGEMSESARTERAANHLPRDRERRLAASQILRTQFLRTDSDGNIVIERSRSRNTHTAAVHSPIAPIADCRRSVAADPLPVDPSASANCPVPSAFPTDARSPIPGPFTSASSANSAVDSLGRNTTSPSVPSVCSVVTSPPTSSPSPQPNPASSEHHATQSSPCLCASVVNSPPRRLRGIDHKRALKAAIAAVRAQARAPT